MKPLSILTFLLLALTSYSQNSQVFNKKILYTPEEEGYEIEVALKYKFSSSPDGLDCYMELVTEHIEVENSRYLYKDKWYTINDLEFAEDKVLFREKINTRIDVIANAFEGESNLGEVSLPNLLADWGVPSTVITDYSIVMNALTLRNIKIVNTNTKHMSGLDYRIQKQISRGEVNEVLQRARAAEERGDLEKALSLYQSILVSGNGHNHYSGGWSESCSNDLKISIRENISRLKKLTKKSNPDSNEENGEGVQEGGEGTQEGNEHAQESSETESDNSGDSEAKNNPSKVEQFEQIRNNNIYQEQYENVFDWDAAQAWGVFENSELELRRRMDEMQARDKINTAFWKSLVISNKLTPENQIQQYRQKLVNVKEKHDRTVQQGINDARSLANEHPSKEGLIAGAVVAGTVAAAAKAEERQAREKLKKELTQNFREIQRKLLKIEEPNIENNKHAAANSVDSKREASYINWVNYWECRVSKIKSGFSIYKTNWIDPNCTPANKSIPSEIANPSANDLFKSAKRKYSSGVDYLIQASNPVLDAALGKDPENIEMLFTKYKWNRETACLWKSRSNPARDYLEICLNLAPSYSFAIEAMLWELANDDHLEASYLMYLKKYPAGLFAKDAQKGVDYFRQVSEINRLIELDQLRSAVAIHAPLKGIHPEFFKSSDMPNAHLLRPIYADIRWNEIKNVPKSKEAFAKKINDLTKLREYYNFQTEYPDISKTYNIGYKINAMRNKLAGRNLTISVTTTLLGTTDIESMGDHTMTYIGTPPAIVDERQNLPAVYSSTNYFNSIEGSLSLSRTLVTIAGPIYLAGIGGFSLGPAMLNRKITLNQDQTDQALYTAMTEPENNIPEYLYYKEPGGVSLNFGLSLSNFIGLYLSYSMTPPEIGSGAVVDNKYEENVTWGEALWLDDNGDDKIYTKGYGAILQLPLSKKNDLALIGSIDYLGGKKWFDNTAPYKRLRVGCTFKKAFIRFTSAKYTLEEYTFLPGFSKTNIDADGNYYSFNGSSAITSITYTSLEIGIRFDMNKDSHLYRSGTTKAKIFDYKEDFDEAPKDEAPKSAITKGGRYELLKQ